MSASRNNHFFLQWFKETSSFWPWKKLKVAESLIEFLEDRLHGFEKQLDKVSKELAELECRENRKIFFSERLLISRDVEEELNRINEDLGSEISASSSIINTITALENLGYLKGRNK